MRQMEALLRGVGPNLPSHWGLIRPVVHNLHVDSEAGQIASQHQAGRTGAHDAYLTLEGGLGHVPEQREAVGALGVDFILGLAHLVRVGHLVCCWRHDGGVWGGGRRRRRKPARAGSTAGVGRSRAIGLLRGLWRGLGRQLFGSTRRRRRRWGAVEDVGVDGRFVDGTAAPEQEEPGAQRSGGGRWTVDWWEYFVIPEEAD